MALLKQRLLDNKENSDNAKYSRVKSLQPLTDNIFVLAWASELPKGQ